MSTPVSAFEFSLRAATLATALLVPLQASTTNGCFSHGYGAKSQGIAGAGIALPQDGLAAASNPAGTAAVGSRLDLGLTVFAPSRAADIAGNAFGPNASYSGDDTKTFLIPDFGYTRQINPSTAIELSLRSLVATATFLIAAIATTYVVRHIVWVSS